MSLQSATSAIYYNPAFNTQGFPGQLVASGPFYLDSVEAYNADSAQQIFALRLSTDGGATTANILGRMVLATAAFQMQSFAGLYLPAGYAMYVSNSPTFVTTAPVISVNGRIG